LATLNRDLVPAIAIAAEVVVVAGRIVYYSCEIGPDQRCALSGPRFLGLDAEKGPHGKPDKADT
jgi:hypothetical protein